jgi:hypothetical protein
MEKTYLEILAENDFLASKEYEYNPKDALANQSTYEDNIKPEEHHEDELENQNQFESFAGSHQLAALPPKMDATNNIAKTNPLFDKNIRIHVLNIDSRFRSNSNDTTTNFTFKLLKRLKNIVSVRLSSLEFPNVYYTFSAARGNVSFEYFIIQGGKEVGFTINIPEGNYDPDTLASTLTTLMGTQNFLVTFNYGGINSGRMTFQCPQPFRLDFSQGNYITYSGRTIGDNLGFTLKTPNAYVAKYNASVGTIDSVITYVSGGVTQTKTTFPSQTVAGAYSVTGEALVDTIDNNYVFLTLDPDWKVVTNQASDKNIHYSFAKIIIDVPKGDILYDNGANTLTKEYFFQQPTDIGFFPVSITDPYDQQINLLGTDFSFSLEFKEILSQELYETMRS